jgi:hypothetical protein
MQSKKRSLTESLTNVAVGMGVSLASQYAIFPWFGITDMSFGHHLGITAWFTAISILRSYLLRRWFNRNDV